MKNEKFDSVFSLQNNPLRCAAKGSDHLRLKGLQIDLLNDSQICPPLLLRQSVAVPPLHHHHPASQVTRELNRALYVVPIQKGQLKKNEIF